MYVTYISFSVSLSFSLSLKDIDLGDTPVLCIAMVRDKVWMGFEIGYLCIYDATTHDTLAQVHIV